MWLKGLENIRGKKKNTLALEEFFIFFKRKKIVILIIKEDVYGWCLVVNKYLYIIMLAIMENC